MRQWRWIAGRREDNLESFGSAVDTAELSRHGVAPMHRPNSCQRVGGRRSDERACEIPGRSVEPLPSVKNSLTFDPVSLPAVHREIAARRCGNCITHSANRRVAGRIANSPCKIPCGQGSVRNGSNHSIATSIRLGPLCVSAAFRLRSRSSTVSDLNALRPWAIASPHRSMFGRDVPMSRSILK